MPAPSAIPTQPAWKTLLLRHETILLLVLVAEWVYFYFAGTTVRGNVTLGFGTMNRQFDILRHSCEIGLLALALTPVILTGGIDLSVGSLMGLCAILFGKLWQDAHFPIALAVLATLGIGAMAGGLNAALITLLRLPPLIVTLGTYSLFRGLAEAITHGADTFTNFPASFLFLGQERVLGLPTQAWIFFAVAAAYWLLVHQTTFGRSFRAIGYAPEGARYAGLPVERRVALVYVLAGFVSALAAIIYTARLGQAKADAGMGYELFAITAVVLGGTSIFGGVGTIYGTLLGVIAIGVLKSGLSTLPKVLEMGAGEEMSGMLTGALLLLALTGGVLPKILSNWRARRQNARLTPQPSHPA
jgi:rhamnose transport system permease protein